MQQSNHTFTDLRLEMELIHACVYMNRTVAASAFVRAEHFYDQRHAAIFTACLEAEMSNPASKMHAVRSARGVTEEYLTDIRNEKASMFPAATQNNAKRIATLARARQTLQRFHAMTQVDSTADADDYLELVSGFDLSDIATGEPTGRWAKDIVSSIRDAAEGRTPQVRVHRTGIESFDWHFNGGLRDGRLYVIGGIPGSGKSALVGQMSGKLSESGAGTTLIATLEMDGEETVQRMLASATGCSADDIESGRAEDWYGILERGRSLDLYVMDRPPYTIDDIRAQAKLLRAQRGLSLVVVDYLHLLEAPGKTQIEQLTHVTKRCKLMARELRCPVILLSSFNRTAFDTGNPSMKNFRGSGSIESDADAVIVVHRPGMFDKDTIENYCQLHVLKNRKGKTGQIELEYIGAQFRFGPWTHGGVQ